MTCSCLLLSELYSSKVWVVTFLYCKQNIVTIILCPTGIVPEDLNLFLEGALPKRKKRGKCILGVLDPKLGAAISEALEIPCSHTGAVPEILRGIFSLSFLMFMEGNVGVGFEGPNYYC